MIKNVKGLISLLFIAMMLQVAQAGAVVPHLPDLVQNGNLWKFTYFNDASTTHNISYSEPICFESEATVGTHQRYRWYVQSNPNISGKASQEGDQITMIGDYFFGSLGARYTYAKSLQWELTSDERNRNGSGMGHHQIYLRYGDYQASAHFNLHATRAGFCRTKTQIDPTKLPTFEAQKDDQLIEEIRKIIGEQ